MRARILLPTALLFALTLAAMGAGAVQLYGADMDNGQHERAELFGGMVAGGLTTMMLEGGHAQVPDLLRVMAGHRRDVDTISLVRPDGEVRFSSRPALVGTRPWPRVADFDQQTLVAHPSSDPSQYALVQPIANAQGCHRCHSADAGVNGYLDVRFSRRLVTDAKLRLARTLAMAGLPALAALLAIAWWLLGREAVRPLKRIVATMRRAESGELSVTADEGRPDELGVAARGFDAMLAALRRSQEQVEALYREHMVRADRFASVGELAANLAHEIRNPLAGLSGALELLAEDLRDSPQKGEVVAEMRRQVERLTHIMDSLLSFARPPKVRLRSTDVNRTLDQVLFLVGKQPRKGNQRLDVDLHLAPDLPEALADPAQVQQVFLNLCLNAVQAMNGTGGMLTVRSYCADSLIVVEVADTGPGIPAEVRPHIFKPFFTTKRNGTGLGLAISARIVADHGGQIDCQCPSSGGAVFSVKLLPASVASENQHS